MTTGDRLADTRYLSSSKLWVAFAAVLLLVVAAVGDAAADDDDDEAPVDGGSARGKDGPCDLGNTCQAQTARGCRT